MKPQRITFDKAMAVAGPAGTLQMRTDELAVACLGLPGFLGESAKAFPR